jgi:hypothetical protein
MAERPGTPLILTRASVSRPSGQWREDDYDVIENGVVAGRIFFLDAVGPQGRPWMWASGHNGDIRRAAHGYEDWPARSLREPSPLDASVELAPAKSPFREDCPLTVLVLRNRALLRDNLLTATPRGTP